MSSMSSRLVDIVKDESLAELTKDSAEIILDSALDEGVLKDLPLVGMIFGIRKVYLSIQDRLFVKKLITFLEQIEEIPAVEREKQIELINNDFDYTVKIGEKLLFILDKADSTEKAKLIGLLFKSLIERKIDLSNFHHASHIVNSMFLDDLVWYIKNTSLVHVDGAGEFVANGLMTYYYEREYDYGKYDIGSAIKVYDTKIGELIRGVLSAYL